jgi:hypothetical protein
MKALDDIILGFLIFFAVERTIRLLGASIIEPWAESKTEDRHKVEAMKIGGEIAIIITFIWFVHKNRRFLSPLNRS